MRLDARTKKPIAGKPGIGAQFVSFNFTNSLICRIVSSAGGFEQRRWTADSFALGCRHGAFVWTSFHLENCPLFLCLTLGVHSNLFFLLFTGKEQAAGARGATQVLLPFFKYHLALSWFAPGGASRT